MSPFEHYGIPHLSPSSINTYIASPAKFILDKVLKKPTGVGPAAHRGTAVESGLVAALNGEPIEKAIAIGQLEFGERCGLMDDGRVDKETKAIAPMIETAYDALSGYGQPTSTQGKVEWRPDGLSVPIIGFYDLAYEKNGIVVDLKTSHTIPSAIKINHARQVALYATCLGDNIDAQIAYVSPKKSAVYHLENTRAHLDALAKAAMTIQRFLSISTDPMELVALTVPDLESFYWTDPDTRQAAWDVWRI